MSNNGKACWNQNPDTNNNQRKAYRRITTNHPQSSNQPQAYGTFCGKHITTLFYLLLFLLVYLIKMILFASFRTIEQQQQCKTIPRTLLRIAFASSLAIFFSLFHVISDPGTVRFLLTFMYSVTLKFSFFLCSVVRHFIGKYFIYVDAIFEMPPLFFAGNRTFSAKWMKKKYAK